MADRFEVANLIWFLDGIGGVAGVVNYYDATIIEAYINKFIYKSISALWVEDEGMQEDKEDPLSKILCLQKRIC